MPAIALVPFLAAAPAVSAQAANLAPTVVVAEPNGGERLSSVPEPEGHGGPFLIVYAATDPDGDPVTVRLLAVQQAGAVGAPPLTGPIVIAEGLPATGTFLWDTRTIPDGAGYRIRVEATDNGAGGVPGSGVAPLTGVDETDGRFLVDNTPPTATLGVVEGEYLTLDQLPLAATVGDLPFFPPEGVVRPHARPLHITLTLDPSDPGERALEPGDTLDLATVAPGRHRLRLHVRDQSGLVANDVRVIRVLTAAEGFALVQARLEALQADPTCAPGALPALAEAHTLLAAALRRQRSGNVKGFVQKLAEAAGQLQLAGAAESRAGELAETLALLVRDLLQPRVEYLETALGAADPQVTPIRGFFTAGVALLAGDNFSGAILEFKKAQNRINALDTQSPEIVRLAPSERVLQTGEFTVRYAFADFLTDIAPTSVLLEVDGANRTAEATHSDHRLRIEFAGATALPEGDHEFRITVADVQGNAATRVDRLWVDLTAPTAAWTSPAEGWVTSNRPLARIEYADAAPGSGIDPAEGIQILLDGADVTSEALRGEDFATHQAPIGSELTEGTHVYSATIQDRSGRSVTAVRTFAVDSIPPLVTIASPVDGSSSAAYILDYRVLASDTNGVVLVSATINDHDATGQFTTEPDGFLWHPVTGDPVYLQLGENVFRVTVADPAGNATGREVRFTLTSEPGGGVAPHYVLTIVEGDGQEGPIGQCLQGPPIPDSMRTEPGKPLRVRVHDANDGGRLATGVPLVWEGAGFAVDAPGFSTVTNSVGEAAVRYVQGRVPGPQEVRCSVLGDASAESVTFHMTAVLPTLTVEMPYRREENILVGSSEAFLRATLTRPGPDGPLRVQSNVRVEVLDADDNVLVDPPGIYVNPRSQCFNDRGQAGIDVIADTVGLWRVRLSVDDFPELTPETFEINSLAEAMRGGFRSAPMLAGTPAGQITVHAHPITIAVDMTAMQMEIPGDAERYTIFLSSPLDHAGAPIYEFEEPGGVWHPGAWYLTQDGSPTFNVRVRPVAETTGLRPSPVAVTMLYQVMHMNAEDELEPVFAAERLEIVGVGAPEVRIVRDDGTGHFIHDIVPTADAARIKTTALVDGPFFYAEARLPVGYAGAGAGPEATLKSLDRCGIDLPADGQNPPPSAASPLEPVAAEATSRFSVWRSRELLGLLNPRRSYEREPVAPITPTPFVETGGDIVGPAVDLPPDDVANNVVRTGDELAVEIPVGGSAIVSRASPGSQIIDPRHDTGAERPVNNRVNLSAGERIDGLDIEMLAGGRADGWATLDTIDNAKDKTFLDLGTFQFENQHGVLGQFGRAVTLGPFRLPGASGKVKIRGTFIPDGISGEEFREFTIRDRDSRGSAANPADPMGTTYRNVRVGPAMKVVNLVVQFAGASRSREQLQRDVRVLDAIYKQACIRFELLDGDVVEDPRIEDRRPPPEALPEDVPNGRRANLDEYIVFRKDSDTKLNVFLASAVNQNQGEPNTAGVARNGTQFCVVEGALSGAVFQTTLAHELAHLLGDLDDAYPLASDSAAERAAKDRDNHDMLMYHSGQSAHRIPTADALRCRANTRAVTK